jgi:1A family penicillin-binding protein
MRLPAFSTLTRRDWLAIGIGSVAIVLLLLATTWSVRHAWAVSRLTRGVGDTTFLDASGRPWFRLDEQRHDVPLSRMSPFIRDAVVAVEDHRFYWHPGIDPIGTARSLLHNVRSAAGTQGGSTITQQLARTLFLSNAETPARKLKEALLAVQLELFLTKDQILELYLNRVYVTSGLYGVEAAARSVLGKPSAQLTLGEAALIAGVIRGPVIYSPWTHFDAARRRSHVVLQRMREEARISTAQERAARAEPIRVATAATARSSRHGYAKQSLRQQFRDIFGGDHPPDWTVRTTFVPDVQDAAEAAVRDGLRRLRLPGLQAALVALDPSTGDVLAMVGGADFATTQFNRAVRSRRQPGSAFKPFVYAVALERGFSPVSSIDGLQHVSVDAAEGPWSPRDERPTSEDALAMREALLESNNAAAVQLQQRVGAARVVRFAASIGIRDQPEVPSLALGSGLVSPLELTAAYAVFANQGARVRPRMIRTVHDGTGATVHRTDVDREQVLSRESAYQMFSMLADVVTRGTGADARALGVRGVIGGKTGTTSGSRDAWFVGFSSSVVAGVWVGFDQPQPISQRASGSRVALPIWADFMRRTARRLPARAVAAPSALHRHELCRISYSRPVSGCPTYVEYFKDGDAVPGGLCPLHEGTLKQEAQRAVRGILTAIGKGILDIFK